MVLIFSLIFSLIRMEAHAEIIFEGAYKIMSDKQHVGYVLQRYEFDPKTKIFTSIYFIKTNEKGGNLTESFKAQANDKFQPLNYQYTSQAGDKIKLIDAKFSKENIMQLEITDGKTKKSETHKIPKGTFLSTFLGYMMLQKGIKKDVRFKYSAVAEEEGSSYNGEAFVEGEDQVKNFDVFRIKIKFKGTTFLNYITKNGEILKNEMMNNLTTELQNSTPEATAGLMLPHKSVTLLFGKVPTCKINVLNKKDEGEKAPDQKSSKKEEVPTS